MVWVSNNGSLTDIILKYYPFRFDSLHQLGQVVAASIFRIEIRECSWPVAFNIEMSQKIPRGEERERRTNHPTFAFHLGELVIFQQRQNLECGIRCCDNHDEKAKQWSCPSYPISLI